MATLLKAEIKQLAEDGSIKILGDAFKAENLQSCSYDLRVGTVFKGKKIYNDSNTTDQNKLVAVKPSEIITILTLEEVKLPRNILGTVFAINKLSSAGFLILNPGHIDPGYQGPISICAINLSNETKWLEIGESPIFTILFDKLPSDAEAYANDPKVLALDRKKKEKKFFVERSRKLTTSFFDLFKLDDFKDHLQKVVLGIFFNKLWQILLGISAFIALIVGITKIPDVVESLRSNKYKNERKILNDSLTNLQNQYDSLLKKENNSRDADTSNQK